MASTVRFFVFSLFYYARVEEFLVEQMMVVCDGVCKSRAVLCERHFRFFFFLLVCCADGLARTRVR